MKALNPFVFIHPDTGLDTTESRGEPARLLHTLHSQNGEWMEAFDLASVLRSLEVPARMTDINKTHGPNLIHKRNGRKTLNGRQLKEYRINPDALAIEQP